jgi:hypothetical protein
MRNLDAMEAPGSAAREKLAKKLHGAPPFRQEEGDATPPHAYSLVAVGYWAPANREPIRASWDASAIPAASTTFHKRTCIRLPFSGSHLRPTPITPIHQAHRYPGDRVLPGSAFAAVRYADGASRPPWMVFARIHPQ